MRHKQLRTLTKGTTIGNLFVLFLFLDVLAISYIHIVHYREAII